MGKITTVKERDLLQALKRLRDMRAWAVRARIDPWAFRQALLLALHLDTVAARERGIGSGDIQAFDRLVEANAAEVRLGKGGLRT